MRLCMCTYRYVFVCVCVYVYGNVYVCAHVCDRHEPLFQLKAARDAFGVPASQKWSFMLPGKPTMMPKRSFMTDDPSLPSKGNDTFTARDHLGFA